MTRAQFLNDLYRRLPGLTQEQAEQHLTYYAEMLADRMEEGMTEEEAVASMEPLDVIAQRILQDEGNPEPGNAPQLPPPSPRPPRYPDPPKTGASRSTKVPDAVGKRNWRKIGRIALWAVAILAAVSALGRWYNRHNYSADLSAIEEESAVDYGTGDPTTMWQYEPEDWAEYAGEWGYAELEDLEDLWGLSIGPDGISGSNFSIGPDGILIEGNGQTLYVGPSGIETGGGKWNNGEISAASRYRQEDDVCRADTDEVSGLSINWTTGMIEIRGWDEEYIQFQEYSNDRLTQAQKLRYRIDGGTLQIDNHAGKEKGLTVWLPRTVLNTLSVETTSADIYFDQVSADYGKISTTGGIINLSNSTFYDLSIDGTSGSAVLSSVTAVHLESSITSGDTCLEAVAAEEMEISSTSGNITGFAAGIILELDTSSGKIDVNTGVSGSLAMESTSGAVTASMESGLPGSVEVETTSGAVCLLLPDYCGFELGFDSTSGYFEHGPFSVVRTGDVYVKEGWPSMSIHVETTSGNLILQTPR